MEISKEGALSSAQAENPRKSAKKRLFIYGGLQLFNGICTFIALNFFKVRWQIAIPVQWIGIFVILYFHVKTARFVGMHIEIEADFINKWDVIQIGGSDERGIVYRIDTASDGTTSFWIFPFHASRWIVGNLYKFWLLRFAIGLRLIK